MNATSTSQSVRTEMDRMMIPRRPVGESPPEGMAHVRTLR